MHDFLLEARDGKLTLSGTDLDISVSVSIEAEVEAEGSVTVPAKKFAEIARELPAAPVHITADGVEIRFASNFVAAARNPSRVSGESEDRMLIDIGLPAARAAAACSRSFAK